MTVYMDVQRHLPSNHTAAAVRKAAIAIQKRFGVMYRNYWIDERAGKVFCLIEAPTTEGPIGLQREAYGLVADGMIEVVDGQ